MNVILTDSINQTSKLNVLLFLPVIDGFNASIPDIQKRGAGIVIFPIFPIGCRRFVHFKFPVGVFTAYADQFIVDRIPDTLGLIIKKHDRKIIRPSISPEGQYLSVNLTAVHDSRFRKFSVGYRKMRIAKNFVRHLAFHHNIERIRP